MIVEFFYSEIVSTCQGRDRTSTDVQSFCDFFCGQPFIVNTSPPNHLFFMYLGCIYSIPLVYGQGYFIIRL